MPITTAFVAVTQIQPEDLVVIAVVEQKINAAIAGWSGTGCVVVDVAGIHLNERVKRDVVENCRVGGWTCSFHDSQLGSPYFELHVISVPRSGPGQPWICPKRHC